MSSQTLPPKAKRQTYLRVEGVARMSSRAERRTPDPVGAWIIFSAACTTLGWALSLIGHLNALGYLVGMAVVLGIATWRWLASGGPTRMVPPLPWLRAIWDRRARFRRPLPLVYLAVVILAFLGGALYPPNNYDALTYRLPRVLHWWAAGQWYWIPTASPRMNYSATGFEWLMLPVLTVTQSDRLLFLANLVSYLLLPSLVFSVFIQLGVAAKAAWHWMWLLPCGYCFAMQAGSIGNDAFAAVYALAAIHYSLRAVRTRRVEDLWVTGLSIGLLTGAKASNIPLVLPALLLAAPAVRLLRTRMAGSLCMGFLVLVVSFAPIAALNKFFTGDWTGDPTADLQVRNPAIGLLGNTLQLVDQSLQPPVLPLGVRRAQDRLLNSLPANLRDALNRDFPRFALDIGELPQEESAGLGLGITLLAAVAVFAPLLERKPAYKSPLHWFTAHRTGLLVGAAAWLACLAYMCSFGSEATARLLSPYYPLLILPLVLHRANASIVQRRWWKTLAVVGAGSTLIGLILTPSRPLWPARPVIEAVMSAAPTNQQLARIDEVYKVYGDRHDLLAPLRAHIPVDVQTIGLVAGPNDSEIALWRPFGRRRVVELVEGDAQPLELVPQPKWVVVKEDALHSRGESLQSWLTRIGGSVVDQETITSIIEEGPMVWDLVRLGD